ncbi:MAG: NUDIX domain-containing protein [Spirochaetes bacterium]|nr:NUDIX domain-containing protein [Spirochaetota bacterium]
MDVVAAVVLRDGHVLLGRRCAEKRNAGWWEFPGGKVEPRETPEEALQRELAEEFCCSSTVASFIARNSHDYGDLIITLHAYYASLTGEIACQTDHDLLSWTPLSDLATVALAPADRFLVPILTP